QARATGADGSSSRWSSQRPVPASTTRQPSGPSTAYTLQLSRKRRTPGRTVSPVIGGSLDSQRDDLQGPGGQLERAPRERGRGAGWRGPPGRGTGSPTGSSSRLQRLTLSADRLSSSRAVPRPPQGS